MSAHSFEFETIDGGTLSLGDYKGKAVLVVNTASECGYTDQYAGLESLWARYGHKGLVVLEVPSNDFGEQEPGSEAEIKRFCATNYGVDFPMTAKQTVVGDAAHPFYRWVVAEHGEVAAPQWNFSKYLVGPDGQLAGLWPSEVEPTDEQITGTIEELL